MKKKETVQWLKDIMTGKRTVKEFKEAQEKVTGVIIIWPTMNPDYPYEIEGKLYSAAEFAEYEKHHKIIVW